MDNIIIIGYGGHSYVAIDIINSSNNKVSGYCDKKKQDHNPYELEYIGTEDSPEAITKIKSAHYFVTIGNNEIRKKISLSLIQKTGKKPISIVHQSAVLSPKCSIGTGTMISAGVVINALAVIGEGVICNTGSIIEHECTIGNYTHIAPGAVIAGDVTVGSNSFIGANSVIREGITIGDNVLIGAGSVILEDVKSNCTVVGNPGKIIKHNS